MTTALGALGLDGKQEIVVYSDPTNGMGEDGRILWTLKVAGIEKVKVLNGGWAAWQSSGGAVSAEATSLAAVTFEPVATHYNQQVDTAYVQEHMADIVLLDVRSAEEYNGEINFGEARNGHIPSATHLYFGNLLNVDGTIKEETALMQIFEGAGL